MNRLFTCLTVFSLVLPMGTSGETKDIKNQKIGPYLQYELLHSDHQQDILIYPVRIEVNNIDAYQHEHILTGSWAGTISTANVGAKTINSLVKNKNIRRIELSAYNRMLLDHSLPAVQADLVHNGELGHPYKGRNVIVGIVDSGIDWTHADFIDESGMSRILYLWDMTRDGQPPEGFDYGSEFDNESINTIIRPGFTGGETPSPDSWGHGTHVAGIAAGNGLASGNGKPSGKYVGVAPLADLIIVKASESALVTDNRVIDGIAYVFNKAEQLAKSAVVNISYGTRRGPHDGSSTYEKAIDSFLGEPGRAIVVAAGNEGELANHAKIDFISQEETETLEILIDENPAESTNRLIIEGWYSPQSNLALELQSPSGNNFSARQGDVFDQSGSFGSIYIYHTGHVNDGNGDKRFVLHISDSDEAQFEGGKWQLTMTGGQGRLDCWLTESNVSSQFSNHIDYSTQLTEPGNARQVITVVSYVTRSSWPSLWSDPWGSATADPGEVSLFSSAGPSRPNAFDNNPANKPDIAAPGESILSSFSSQSDPGPSDHYIATDGVHRSWAGTSMAAPHVTGLIALLFEANPGLTASDVTGILLRSATRDNVTGQGWNNVWGFGKLNVADAIRTTSVERSIRKNLPETLTLSAYPNPFNSRVIFDCNITDNLLNPCSISVFDMLGKKITSFKLPLQRGQSSYSIAWSPEKTIPTGVYFAVLESGRLRAKSKVLYLK